MMKTDPNQTKTVVALLAILALALGATIYRVQAARRTVVTASPTVTVSAVKCSDVQVETVQRSLRNPFKKPDSVRLLDTRDSVGNSAERLVSFAPAGGFLPSIGGEGILPLTEVSAVPSTSSVTTTSRVSTQEPERVLPMFTLMAVVTGARGSYAALRIGGSQTKVVRVGDMVDGRFRLKAIRPGYAALTDGKVTVFAKRGRAEDGQTSGS
jgi:hypothetical protein